jgi:hypothetical protein
MAAATRNDAKRMERNNETDSLALSGLLIQPAAAAAAATAATVSPFCMYKVGVVCLNPFPSSHAFGFRSGGHSNEGDEEDEGRRRRTRRRKSCHEKT